MLIVELNEFSREFLEQGANTLNLKNLKYILKLKSSLTESCERIEHHGLDPWVQWVSIHTGKPLKKHGIIRNSDVEKLKFKQFWEILSERGISTGIWGAMNAKRNKAKLCYFFLPDPWNYSELAYPKSLYDLLFLPRYYSKNYTKISKIRILEGILKLLKFFLNPLLIGIVIRNSSNILKYLISDGINNNNLFGIFDLISTEVFIHYKKKFNPEVSLVFLNSLAHFQHHYWNSNKLNKKGKICLEIIDSTLGKLLKEIDNNEPLIILNGLSQKNVKNQGYCIYKQISAKKFLTDFQIKFLEIEQCMTNDGHIKFESIKYLNNAKNILDNVYIKSKRVFFTENISSQKDFILFWQIDFYERVEKNLSFSLFDKNYNFDDYFVLLAERSGSHLPTGEIIYRHFNLPKKIINYQFFDYLLSYLNVEN